MCRTGLPPGHRLHPSSVNHGSTAVGDGIGFSAAHKAVFTRVVTYPRWSYRAVDSPRVFHWRPDRWIEIFTTRNGRASLIEMEVSRDREAFKCRHMERKADNTQQ
ncbi:hypothetical protein HPP92_006636 [Vanilla planifolia]|uniref:Uncharacterized protein n=1 Tax=Vanilla planifolia TaxID=51239 RepID=A0A835V8M9_VANPL|nr:hypothetical protein HPP92_006636 [Vanilla planifolia]